MAHLRNIINGMASVFDSFSSIRPYLTDSGGFDDDALALANDADAIGSDFKKQSDLVYGTITAIAS